MKKWIYVVCAMVMAFSLTACGSTFEPSVTSMYIQKDGKITYAVVESFEKDYYSLEEFQSMINREVEACNSRYSEPAISVDSLEVKDGTLYLLMEFVDAGAYAAYSEEYCFVGTISKALDEGRAFDMVFRNADYEEYKTADVTGRKDDYVLITQTEGIVELEKPVKYVSNNVEILSERMVQVMPIEDENEYAYIIY